MSRQCTIMAMGSFRPLDAYTTIQAHMWESSMILFREAAAFKMSPFKEAAPAINHLARECFDLLGASDGSALFEFVEEYLCGDDPANSDGELSSGKVSFL